MYEFTSRVRYSETGPDAAMKLSALVARLQDCAVFHCDAIGRGPADWEAEQAGWLIMNWRIRLERMPRLAEAVTTRTWANSFKGVRGGRNYTVKDEAGRLLASAESLWIWYNRKLGKPAKVPEIESTGYGIEEKLPGFEHVPKKIVLPKEEGTSQKGFEILHTHIDTNHHVNNLQYIDMALAYMPEGRVIREMYVDYLRQVRLGDRLTPRVWLSEDSYTVSLENEAGEDCANVQFIF